MKGANTDIEIIFNGFSKKMKFEAIVSFKTQNVTSSQLWIHCKNCVTMLHNERGKERHGNYIRGFSEKKKKKKKKKKMGQFGHFCQKWCVLITLHLLEVFYLNFVQ